ncbi:MAG: 4'-phosphopantetheinyl transferase superfamily protein [Clostridia bacterium]|nr:4'-phosphopantetheinyl transferase superfamily protein [Clostridia bacterium]
MTEIYFCGKDSIYGELKKQLSPRICGGFDIKRTQNGKPYIDGNPVYFSLSHSGNTGLFAISDNPVGVDLELYKKRKFQAVLSRFTLREQEEIKGEFKLFLKNWVVKEAYIKMLGATVADTLFSLEYAGGKLYTGGKQADCEITVKEYKDIGIYAICAGEIK